MTLEKLIRIVIEAVEKALALQRLRVAILLFDGANGERVERAAARLGAPYRRLGREDANEATFDVVFTDALPASHFAKLALGIIDSAEAGLLHETVMNGGTVFVLGGTPAILERTPPACAALLQKYRAMLESYGYIFLDGLAASKTESCDLRGRRVIGGGDVALLPDNCQLLADRGTVITSLAAERARDKKIAIELY